MKASLDDRIARADELAKLHPAAAELLNFYRELALFQKQVFEGLQSTDLAALLRHFPALLELARRIGPEPLGAFTSELVGPAVQQELLAAAWQGLTNSPEARFFARVLLQPYAEYLASRGDIPSVGAEPVCPFCNARPVAGVLRGEGDGAKRWLLCSLCSTEWQYRRVVCPNCGEENKDRLPIYIAAEFDYIRVDACDNCRTYLKSVDLTKNGRAIPVVDELATVALNIWAEEHGYLKLESNLLGM